MASEGWVCRECGHANQPARAVCRLCCAQRPQKRRKGRKDRTAALSQFQGQEKDLNGTWFCRCTGAPTPPGPRFAMEIACYPGMDPLAVGGRATTQSGTYAVKGEYDVGAARIVLQMLFPDPSGSSCERTATMEVGIVSEDPVRMSGTLEDPMGGSFEFTCQLGTPPSPEIGPAPVIGPVGPPSMVTPPPPRARPPPPPPQRIRQPPEGTVFLASDTFCGPLRGYYFGVSEDGVLGYHLDPRPPPPNPAPGTNFAPCPEWRGPVPGYYFALTAVGLGYHRDPRCDPGVMNPFELGAVGYRPQGQWATLVVDPGPAESLPDDPLSLLTPDESARLLEAAKAELLLLCKRQRAEAERLRSDAAHLEEVAAERALTVAKETANALEAEKALAKVAQEEEAADVPLKQAETRSGIDLHERQADLSELQATTAAELKHCDDRVRWMRARGRQLVRLHDSLDATVRTLSGVQDKQEAAATLLQRQLTKEGKLLESVTQRIDSLATKALELKRARQGAGSNAKRLRR